MDALLWPEGVGKALELVAASSCSAGLEALRDLRFLLDFEVLDFGDELRMHTRDDKRMRIEVDNQIKVNYKHDQLIL